jgi:hypothetical protein
MSVGASTPLKPVEGCNCDMARLAMVVTKVGEYDEITPHPMYRMAIP